MLVIPRTKHIESRMFDLPLPFKPVMELKLSSLHVKISIHALCTTVESQGIPSRDDRPHRVGLETLSQKSANTPRTTAQHSYINDDFDDPHLGRLCSPWAVSLYEAPLFGLAWLRVNNRAVAGKKRRLKSARRAVTCRQRHLLIESHPIAPQQPPLCASRAMPPSNMAILRNSPQALNFGAKRAARPCSAGLAPAAAACPFSTSSALARRADRHMGVSPLRRTGPKKRLTVHAYPLPKPVANPSRRSDIKVDEDHGLWGFFNEKRDRIITPEANAAFGATLMHPSASRI